MPYEEVMIEEKELKATGVDIQKATKESDNLKIQNEIELKITNEIADDKKPNNSNDKYMDGQITLEL